jgi:hypothetical protein
MKKRRKTITSGHDTGKGWKEGEIVSLRRERPEKKQKRGVLLQ